MSIVLLHCVQNSLQTDCPLLTIAFLQRLTTL